MPTAMMFFDNATQIRARGIDLEVEHKFARGELARVSYALQETEDVRNNRDLTGLAASCRESSRVPAADLEARHVGRDSVSRGRWHLVG